MARMKLGGWSAYLLCVLSGGLLTAGFPRFELPFVAWIALLPLLVTVWGRSPRQAFILGYLCGLIHYVTALYWIGNVVQQYGGLPLPLAVLILLLLCGYLALYPAVFALFVRQGEKHPVLWVWLLPSLWVTLEWIRAHALSGFPWANLGYSQTPFLSLIQVADLTGVYGVSWLIVLVNGWLAYLLLMRRLHWSLSLLVLCLVFVGVYGWKRFQVVDAMQQQTDLWVVGLAQGNIDQFRKWDPAYQQETLRRYQQLSVLAAGSNPRPALLVWPETAAPFFYDMENKLTPQLQEIVREMGIPLLFGSPGAALQEGVTRLYNKVYLIDTEGKTVGDYAKQHLVPFGEYVPLQKLLFFVHRLVEAAGDFAAGRDQLPIVLDGRRLGVLICYEAIFPELSRSAVRRGANVLVNVTNDAWFGTSSAPYQHLEMARWRAVENRVPLIRCANTGISTVFEPSGRSGQMLPLNETGYLTCAVHPVKMTTVYAVWGDWFAWLCVLTALCGLLYFPRGSKRGGILL